MEHFHVLGVRIVLREIPVEVDIHRNHFDAEPLEQSWREGAGRAVAAGRHHFQLALDLRPVGEIGEIDFGEVLDEFVAAARGVAELAVQHDVAQPAHLVRSEGDRALRAHLHAGPAVVVVRGGDHRDRRRVERELREIGHGREREPDVLHLHARRHQAGHQRIFDRGGIGAEVVARRQFRFHAHFVQKRAEAQPQRLHAHQVDLLLEQPARVIFAKAGRLHHRRGFVFVGIGGERRNGFRKHARSCCRIKRRAPHGRSFVDARSVPGFA